MRDDWRLLQDIQEAIERIEKYAARGRAAFEADELVQTWVVHHLQIIGEAARELSQVARDRCPQIPWRKIVGMRHILVHRYFGIDLEAVWDVVERELGTLKSAVESLLKA